MSRVSATAATAAMSSGSIHAMRPFPNGNTTVPRAMRSRCRSITVVKNVGCSTVDATGDRSRRRSIVRWLPCSPLSSPGTGMFDTFTMRSMPVRSAASITLVSSSTCARDGDETRNTARTPSLAAITDDMSPRSPSTTSAASISPTASGLRTNARTGVESARSSRTTRPPRSPAAPITSTVTLGVSRSSVPLVGEEVLR